jgi:two-component system LytT family sensor kinase
MKSSKCKLVFTVILTAYSSFLYADLNKYNSDKIDSLESSLLHEKNDSVKAESLIKLATIYSRNNIDKSLLKITEANSIINNLNIKSLKPNLYFIFGNIYLNKADYQKSLFYYLQALRLFEKKQNFEYVARSLNNIGVVYSYLKNLPVSEKYFKQALVYRKQKGYMKDVGILYTSIGFILTEKKQYKEALYYYKLALDIGKKNKDKYLIAFSYSSLGDNSECFKQYVLAKQYTDSAIQICIEIEDFHNLSINYNYLSSLAIKEHKLKDAEKLLLTSKEFAIKSGIKLALIENYRLLSELYKLQKRFDEAFKIRLEYEDLKDSALNEKTYSQISVLQNEYELEKKNNEIVLLNKDKEIFKANSQKQILLRNILILFSFFVLVFLFVLWRNIKLKQQLNRKLLKENHYLHKENLQAQYEVLISKIDPHFLFNSLSSLSSLILTNKNKAVEFVEHFSILYRNILNIRDDKILDLREEMNITESYLYLQNVRFGNKLNIVINLPNIKYKKVPAFAIQMVVENAIKHNIISKSKPLNINIFIFENNLIIENNLQPKVISTFSMGIGQKNILDRYRLLSENVPKFLLLENCYRVVLPLL